MISVPAFTAARTGFPRRPSPMRRYRPAPLLAACLGLLLTAAARAQAPPDPLRLVPDQADVAIKVEKPRQLAESVTANDLLKQLQTLDPVKELLDSTIYRRFYQLVAYFEKQLGAKWPELLDRLGGGGIVAAGQLQVDNAPALLVLQGTDAALTRRFVDLGLQVVEQEVARSESKERIKKESYRGVETVRLGDSFHAAAVGAAVLVSNKAEGLRAALDLQIDGPAKSLAKSPKIVDARKLLPPDP